jgi:hypothetical protein
MSLLFLHSATTTLLVVAEKTMMHRQASIVDAQLTLLLLHSFLASA